MQETPTTGTIRIDDGTQFQRVTYTGKTANSFTGCTGTPAASNLADAFVSYVDELASEATATFQVIHSTNRDLFVRVRDGGGTPIITFESPSEVNSGGGGVTAIRTSDA